jgi:hypothetical protein
VKIKAPCAVPCVDCPYRMDAPSGLWAEDQYDKLPDYDKDIGEGQPLAVFLCHEQNGHLCAGWVGCHGGENLISIYIEAASGGLSSEELVKTLEHKPRVPLFESGIAAAEHGKEEIEYPGERARKRADAVMAKPSPITPRKLA